jgi:hypothetical protein
MTAFIFLFCIQYSRDFDVSRKHLLTDMVTTIFLKKVLQCCGSGFGLIQNLLVRPDPEKLFRIRDRIQPFCRKNPYNFRKFVSL